MVETKVIESFESVKCLVTGGTGMIGREVVRMLCNVNAVVKVVSLDDIIVNEKAEHVKADLTDLNVCKEVMSGVDYVFHIAGIKGSIEVTKSKPASFFVPLIMFRY